MNTRTVTLVVIIAAIALMCAGIGYAFAAYTQNNGNATNIAYVTLSQKAVDQYDTTPYTFADGITVDYDTFTDNGLQYFKVKDGVTVGASGGNQYYCDYLGTMVLHADYTSSLSTSVPPQKLYVQIHSSTNFDAGGGWTYVITDDSNRIVAVKNTPKTTSAWTAGPQRAAFIWDANLGTNGGYNDVILNVYCGYSTDSQWKTIGTDQYLDNYDPTTQNTVAPKGLDDASIVLTATDEFTITYRHNSNVQGATDYVQKVKLGSNTLLDFNNVGFEAPQGLEFKGWGATATSTTYITEPVNIDDDYVVYAIYGEPTS